MLVVFAAGLLALAGCGRVEKWEYKTVRVENDVHQENAKLDSKSDDYLSLVAYNNRHPGRLAISDYALNQLGADGWEMCGCFVEPETLQPDTRMAAPNTRASAVVMIFKRPAAR